jgi:hypothetical protein
MAEFLYAQVCDAIKVQCSSAPFLALTCDETTSCDNGSWMSISVSSLFLTMLKWWLCRMFLR